MRFLTNTNIPFLKYRRFLVWLSVIICVIALVEVFFLKGLNYGIDFKGGTQLTVKLRNGAVADDVRNALSGAGLRDAQIQQFGDATSQEFLIRAPLAERAEGEDAPAGQEEGRSAEIIKALDESFNTDHTRFDLNQRGSLELAEMLFAADPDNKKANNLDAAHTHYETVADAVLAKRKQLGILSDWNQIADAPGLTPAALEVIKARGTLGNFMVIQNESVGSAIGSELRTKGFWAVVFALIAMLVYIWARFELRFGIGALAASFHDLIVTLGLYAFLGYEFNLPSIAAFLTLVGYSINDTVVIFDRVRENLRRYRRMSLEEILNRSVNETLPRTIMTSGLTLLACVALFFFGGEVLRGFSFIMLVGVIVGTYSSIFIASPFALWWDEFTKRKEAAVAKKPDQV